MSLLCPLFIVALVFLAFSPALKVGFLCDDYLHLVFLAKVVQGQCALLLTNFYRPWIGETNLYLFYRPITELSLALDFLIFSTKAWGYHLTNLLLHTTNCLLVYAIAENLLTSVVKRSKQNFYACLAASFFALNPVHTETICWILSRSDLVSSAFYLLSLLLFLKANPRRNTNLAQAVGTFRKPLSLTSLLAFALALGAKESAVSLPLVLAVYLLTTQSQPRLRVQIAKLLPYFIMLAFYILTRSLALGTIVGGYIGSVGAIMRESFYLRWIESGSLWHLAHPFSSEIFSETHPLRLCQRIIWGLFAGLLFFQASSTTVAQRRFLCFTLVAFATCLLPNATNFMLDSSLTGSRLLYQASIFYNLFLIGLVSVIANSRRKLCRAILLIICLAWCLLYFTALQISSKNWIDSSLITQSLARQIASLCRSTKARNIAIANLPNIYNGTYILNTKGEARGLLRPPLTEENLAEKIIALDFHPFWSRYLNPEHLDTLKREGIPIYYVDYKQLVLKPYFPVSRPFSSQILKIEKIEGPHSLIFKCKCPANLTGARAVLKLVLIAGKKDTFLNRDEIAPLFLETQASLGEYDGRSMKYFPVQAKVSNEPQTLFIDLASLKRFCFKDAPKEISILVSKQFHWQIKEATIQARDTIYPILTAENPLQLYDLSPLTSAYEYSTLPLKLTFDARSIKGAKKLLLQISKPYYLFEHQSRSFKDPLARNFVEHEISFTNLSGSLSLTDGDFKKSGYYQLRLAALSQNNELLGAPSLPYTIFVNH